MKKHKSAITKAAQKFAAKGQIDRAIAELEKLLSQNKDSNIYNTIGDLYLKKMAKREAIESFTKAAEIFREDGFYLKAMALYKKILNISSSEVGALIALAELNAEKDLIGSAIENYLLAAEIYTRDGATEKALEIYEKIVRLTPNIEIKTKIVELYLKIGLSKEAARESAAIASDYLEKNDPDKAREFYLKSISIDPQNISSYVGLSKIAEKANEIDHALGYFKKALSFAPDNKDILIAYSMLAFKTGNVDDAKSAILKLLEIDPHNVQARKLLGNIYLKEGLIEKAWEELLAYIDDLLHAQKWADALELLENFKELDTIAVKCRLASVYKGKGEKEAAVRELKELAKLYEDKALHRDAFQSYKEALALNPSDGTTIDKIKELEKTLKPKTPPPVPVTRPSEEKHAEEEIAISPTPEKAKIPLKKGSTISPEDFEEKKAEADFYAQHGFKDEAMNIYEDLLSLSSDNKEIQNKLQTLKSEVEREAKSTEDKPAEKTPDKATVDRSLKNLLHEFKKGIEKEVEEEDHETHYNLGIAYKEMGLLDDAIREFQIAAKDQNKTLRGSSMLALCYMEKGSYPLAIKEFNKIIEEMSPSDEGYLDTKYSLADAHVKKSDYENALKYYSEIYMQNPKFRDVAHKVELLKTMISKDKPRSKKDRVSYI